MGRDLLLALLALSGCPAGIDGDRDGYDAEVDCDDTRSDVYPGAPESCDGRDEDCDGMVDELAEDATQWFHDADADGYGAYDQMAETWACSAPDGYTSVDGDCEEAVSSAYPGAIEVCDGWDNDCNGFTDDACAAAPSGDISTDDLPVHFTATCEGQPSEARLELFAFGRLLADVFGRFDCTGGLVGAVGPFGQQTDLTDGPALYTPGEGVRVTELVGGHDLDADGFGDLATTDWNVDDDSIVVRIFSSGGGAPPEADDALATLIPPETYGGGWLASAHLVPLGADSTQVAVASYYQLDWYASSLQVGELAEGEIATDDWCYLGDWHIGDHGAAGLDIDGDGVSDVFAPGDKEQSVFLGPLPTEPTYVEADASNNLEGWLWYGLADWWPADLDGDGREDYPFLVEGDEAHEVQVARWDSAAVNFDWNILSIPGALVWPARFHTLDANGDDVADLALGGGSNEPREGAGAVVLEYGPFAGTREAGGGAVVHGAGLDAGVGFSTGVGDTNNDGFDDIVMSGIAANNEGVAGWLLLGGP